jgi:hypothetical protein
VGRVLTLFILAILAAFAAIWIVGKAVIHVAEWFAGH